MGRQALPARCTTIDSMRAARATTTLALVAVLVHGVLAIEEKPEDITVCAACHGHLVFPNNGSNTAQHQKCFERVDAMCASDMAGSYSFCPNVPADQEHGMMHVIEVRSAHRALP